MGALVFFVIFLAALAAVPPLVRLMLWPVYRITGGRLAFLAWWHKMGPL